jgi:hypothetical protein
MLDNNAIVALFSKPALIVVTEQANGVTGTPMLVTETASIATYLLEWAKQKYPTRLTSINNVVDKVYGQKYIMKYTVNGANVLLYMAQGWVQISRSTIRDSVLVYSGSGNFVTAKSFNQA